MMMPMQNTSSTTTTTTNITNIVNAPAEKSPRSDRSRSPRSPRHEEEEAPAEEEKGMSMMCKILICVGCLLVLAAALLAWNFSQAAILLEPFRIVYSKRYGPLMRKFHLNGVKKDTAEFGWTDGFQCKPIISTGIYS
jgi:hypothetical protein